MDTRLLETFCTVLEHGSATKAAVVMRITQPAVSAQIARLEEDLGFRLFERVSNRLRPTPEAEAFHREVERALRTMQGLSRVAEKIRAGESGSLVIASHPSAGISLLPPVLARFASRRPEVRIQLYTRNSEVVREHFQSRAYDIGIAEMPIDGTGFTLDRHAMDCVAILPNGHPLAAHSVITPDLFAGVPFVAISRERKTHHRVMSVFVEHGARCEVVAEVEFFASICGLVANGLGVSVVDPASAAEFAPVGLAVRPFVPAVPYEFAIFRLADREPSVVAGHFLAELEEHIGQFTRSAEKVKPL
nr:LysR substrate-binding domain-containing protein [Microvirga massiliensis]